MENVVRLWRDAATTFPTNFSSRCDRRLALMLPMARMSDVGSFSFKCTLTPGGNVVPCLVSLSHRRHTYTQTHIRKKKQQHTHKRSCESSRQLAVTKTGRDSWTRRVEERKRREKKGSLCSIKAAAPESKAPLMNSNYMHINSEEVKHVLTFESTQQQTENERSTSCFFFLLFHKHKMEMHACVWTQFHHWGHTQEDGRWGHLVRWICAGSVCHHSNHCVAQNKTRIQSYWVVCSRSKTN